MQRQPKHKIAIFIDTAFIGGPGKGLLQLLRHQRSERYSYVVCTFSYNMPKSTEFIDAVRAAGHEIRLLPQRFRFDPAALFEAFRVAREEPFALVQSHGYKTHLIAFALAKRLHLPWFAMTHGWTWESWKVKAYQQLERLLLKQADIAGTVSHPLFRELKDLRRDDRPSRLILNAVDVDEIRGELSGDDIRARFHVTPSQTVLGIIGRLSPEKGSFEALEAFQRVYQELSNTVLLYVGDGPQNAALKQRVAERGLERRVFFAGYQSEMRGFYDAIDLLVIPSLSEGLPNVLLEAMAMGVPSISTRVGAIPDVVQHGKTGWLVSPGDIADLADGLRKAVAITSQWPAIGEAARESLFPRHSPVARVDQFTAVYDELLS